MKSIELRELMNAFNLLVVLVLDHGEISKEMATEGITSEDKIGLSHDLENIERDIVVTVKNMFGG